MGKTTSYTIIATITCFSILRNKINENWNLISSFKYALNFLAFYFHKNTLTTVIYLNACIIFCDANQKMRICFVQVFIYFIVKCQHKRRQFFFTILLTAFEMIFYCQKFWLRTALENKIKNIWCLGRLYYQTCGFFFGYT